MHSGDIAKLLKMLNVIKYDFPKIKISYALLDSGEVLSCINNYCLAFDNIRAFTRDLNFLMDAKFTPRALKACRKKKNMKKKNIFFYWLATCVNYNKKKSVTMEDLRAEFNKIYGLEMKQGRKKRTASAGEAPPHPTECTEQA